MVSRRGPRDRLTIPGRVCPQVLTVEAAAAVEAGEEEWEGVWGMGSTSCSIC